MNRDPVPLDAVMTQRHLPALDGLRAVAVFTVITYHFSSSVLVPGDLGVSAFFVLSGFLITWLLMREIDETGRISLGAFYARRTLRIFPAYYAYIIFALVIDTWRGHPWTHGLIGSAVVYGMNYYNALNNHPVTSVAHAWSLAVEEQFYLVWPLLFSVLWRRGRNTAALGLVVLIAAVLLWRSYLYLGHHVGSAYVYNAFDTRFDNLAVGCLLAVAIGYPWFTRAATAFARWSWLPLITIACLLVSRVGGGKMYHYGPGFTIDAILVAVLLVQLLQLSRTRLWSWLNHPVVRYLGVISYPLYLYHGWGLSVGEHVHGVPMAVQFVIGVAGCIALASGSYFVVERPFLSLKRRWEKIRTPEPSILSVGT